MKCIIFCRCSTSKQDIEAQLKETIDYAKSLGYDDFVEIAKVGASAKTLSKLYLEMVDEMKQNIERDPEIKAVVVWHLNRLCRNEVMAMSIKEYLINNSIQLHIKEPTLSLLNADGSVNKGTELAFSLFATLASQQADELKQKSIRGKKHLRSIHKYIGGHVKFGYMVDNDKFIVPNPTEATIVREIYEFYLTGQWSTKQVTDEINQRHGTNLSRDFIIKTLKKSVYYDNTQYPPIISKELYDEVKKKRQENTTTMPSQYTHRRFANRLIRCEICGRGYTASILTYKCTNNHGHQFNIAWIDGLLWLIASHLESERMLHAEDTDEISQKKAVLRAKIASVDTTVAKVEKARQRAKEMALKGYLSMEELENRMSDLKREAKEVEDNLLQWREELARLEEKPTNRVLEIADRISLADEKEMQAIVRKWVKSVDMNDWHITVHTAIRDYTLDYQPRKLHKLYVGDWRLAVRRFVRNADGAYFADYYQQPTPDTLIRTLAWLNGSKIV